MQFKKFLALILTAIITCSSISIPASAETTSYIVEASPYYNNAKSVSNILSISSNLAECTSTCIGFNDVVQTTVEHTLQKYSGWFWFWNDVDGASWSKTMYDSYVQLSNTKSGLSSGTYRLKSVFTLTNSAGKTETITIYSDEKKVG